MTSVEKISRWDPSEDEVRDPRPYDYAGAKAAIARASRDQSSAHDFTADCNDKYADAEQAYRTKLAKTMVELHNGGAAWTTVGDLARGDVEVARLKRERDVAEGMLKAAEQLAWKASANRRALEQLVEWSMKVNLGGET